MLMRAVFNATRTEGATPRSLLIGNMPSSDFARRPRTSLRTAGAAANLARSKAMFKRATASSSLCNRISVATFPVQFGKIASSYQSSYPINFEADNTAEPGTLTQFSRRIAS